jgi:serine/threonine-protein kinase
MSADTSSPASGSMPHVAEASLVGEVLDGRYRILKKLGEGGMGEVYAAEHIHIEKRFAIKLLRPEILGNPEAVTRFRQEARSSSSIGHRNIIAVEDFGSLADGRIYMCMELLNGAALNDLITTPQPVDRLLNILIQTGHGLAAAHAKGIVHRDMKPENIFVTIGPNNEDVPKLLDFGIAKVAGNDGQNNLTRTGTIFGTPFYMAPEQALGNPVDARTDIYAVGVIMYEVFAGSLPFQGESFMGILTQHITTEPEPVAQRAAKAGRQLPPGLADIITRCMQKNPAQRFSSMDELVNAMVQIYRGIAGPGMSTYMEAFPVSARMAAPTPGPMTGAQLAQGHPNHPMTATVGVGGPPPGQHRNPHMTPPPPMHTPQGGMPVGPSGPNYAVSGSSGLYDPSSSVVNVPKKSKAGLIIAIIAVLAVGGGVTAFVLVSDKGPGTGSGSQVASNDPGSNKVDPNSGNKVTEPDSGTKIGSDHTDIGANPPKTIDAGTTVVDPPAIDAGTVEPPPAVDAGVLLAPAIKVKLFLKSPVPFEVFENGIKLFDGPDSLDVVPGQPRLITVKARGFREKSFSVDGKDKVLKLKLDRIPGPVGPGSGSGTPVIVPPKLDCSNQIKDPKSGACVKQYCGRHANDPTCDIEP